MYLSRYNLNKDPQTITPYLELPRVKSADPAIRLHDNKLTVTRNRSAPPPPGPSAREFSQSSVPGPETTVLPWPIHHDSSTHRVSNFAEPTGNGQTMIVDGVPSQREQPQSETGERSSGFCACLPLANADVIPTTFAVISHSKEVPTERPLAGDLVASSFPLRSGTAAIATTQARDGSTDQLRRSSNVIKPHSLRSRPVEPDASFQIDDDGPLAGAAPPRQGRPRSHSTKSDTSRSTEVDHVLSIFVGKKGSKQLLQLESDEAQYYADILDEVRYTTKPRSAPADLTLRPVSKRGNTA